MDDLDLLAPRIAAGDAAAFGHFLTRVELTVRRSLRSFAARLDVEAVVQEAFLRVWQVAPRFEPDGRPHGLLRLTLRIARNLALDELKRRRVPLASGEEAASIEDVATELVEVDPLLRRLVLDCFGKLPPQNATALSMRLESGGAEPDAVLAARCSMKPNTFLQNVTRARRLLAKCLEERGAELPSALGPVVEVAR